MKSYTFDDVLIVPKFSFIKSRKDCDTSVDLLGRKLNFGIISSNMDTVTDVDMAKAMHNNGAVGCLHRFCSIEENINSYVYSGCNPMVSVGIGKVELERAEALVNAGANTIVVDVAHGACMAVVKHVTDMYKLINSDVDIIVGNFATGKSIEDFLFHSTVSKRLKTFKVSIGSGSACSTRIVTGCGIPSLTTISDCVTTGKDIIFDGGIRNSGDIAKAFAAGAKAVMCGRMFAGCDESPGELVNELGNSVTPLKKGMWQQIIYNEITATYAENIKFHKKYRGSASSESYLVQGKVASHRTPEGESMLVPYCGSVKDKLQELNAGLRSAMSYVGASNLTEFKEKAEFTYITNNGILESMPHGKL